MNTEMGSSRAQVAALQVQLAHTKQEAEAELQQHMAVSEADIACLNEQLLEGLECHASDLESLHGQLQPKLDEQRRHYEQRLAMLHIARDASVTHLQVSLLILTLTCVCCGFETTGNLTLSSAHTPTLKAQPRHWASFCGWQVSAWYMHWAYLVL